MTSRAAYPPIEELGLIGDRRTAAVIDRYGEVVWLCLPDFSSPPVFGALLDRARGGCWRMGPADKAALGVQDYVDDTALLRTAWRNGDGDLELVDLMAGPQTRSEGAAHRTVLRRLRCSRGRVRASVALHPRADFGAPATAVPATGGWRLETGGARLFAWASFPLEATPEGLAADFELREGDEAWMALDWDAASRAWTVDAAEAATRETEAYWRAHAQRLTYAGRYPTQVRRAALTMHLLSYAPSGALVAAPTTSLPERIGGDRNYDYRFAWVRDVSLALAILALLGDLGTAERFMDWLCGLGSSTDETLQVLYRIDGGLEAPQVERTDLEGYCGSKPVRTGNWAARQKQIDSLGYFADCAEIYLRQGGAWKPAYAEVIARIAAYTAEHWREPTNGIWELAEEAHYVVGKVMSWVVLDRAVKIAGRTGEAWDCARWRSVMDEIHGEVMTLGWSEPQQGFRQRYGAEALDASSLLISLMGFLPEKHPRVLANLDALVRELSHDGLINRFDPRGLSRPVEQLPEDFEGAFLPCNFWLASAWAMAGEPERAEEILDRILARTPTGLLAEEMDPRTGRFLGNMPLLFSHAEFVRAALEISKARPLSAVRLMGGMAVQKVKTAFDRP